MLKNIEPWCSKPPDKIRSFLLSPSLLSVLLDESNDNEEKFISDVKKRLNKTPRNLDVIFDAPPFPFDHTEFEDPFCLVEDVSDEVVDIQGLEELSDSEIEIGLRELYARFTYGNQAKRRIKKKELLSFVSRQFFIEMTSHDGFRKEARKLGIKLKKDFALVKKGSPFNINIPATIRKSILRRKIVKGGSLIAHEDIVNFKKKAVENINILVAIDSSKSMDQDGKLERAKKAALSFYYYKSNYFNDTRVDFVSFNETIKKINPIDILSEVPYGMTHTAELLTFVFNHFNRGAKDISELYLITDGYPQHREMEDRVYHGVTLKSAEKLKNLNVKTKIIILNSSDEEKNRKNIEYNSMITNTLKGELYNVDISEIERVMV